MTTVCHSCFVNACIVIDAVAPHQFCEDHKTPKASAAGYLVLEDFAAADEVAKLKERAEQIIEGYDASNPSVFSTVNQVEICSSRICTVLAYMVLHGP